MLLYLLTGSCSCAVRPLLVWTLRQPYIESSLCFKLLLLLL